MSHSNFTTKPSEMQDILNETLEKIAERVKFKGEILQNFDGILSPEQFTYFSECGTFLGANKDNKIVKANFCKNRLCPVCNRRYSAQKWLKMKNITEKIKIEFKPVFAFLTVTVKNVTSAALNSEISKLMKSIDRMHKTALWKNNVLGFFRSLEITYNADTNTYHPHYHYVLALHEHYTGNMVSTYEWRKLWERSARLDYTSQINIQLINEDLDGGIAEVAKYAVKISSVIKHGKEPLKTIIQAIKGRRLISYGGVMKTYAKEFDKVENTEYDGEAVNYFVYNNSFGGFDIF